MTRKDETIEKYLSKYSEHRCLLVKKYRTVFHYVWVLEENGNRFKIHVGKQLYLLHPIRSRLTIGRIGKKLINIRPGFAKSDK